MEKGWIKLHRELLEKPIWTEATPEQKVLLVTLLMMANQSEKQWEWKGEKYTARPGQFVTSLPSLVQKCGKDSSVQKIRTALKRFAKYGFLTDESTPHNRLITIVNWGVYQGLEGASTAHSTDGQQTTNRQLTANKNLRSLKTLKKNNSRKQAYGESSPLK
jgi:DNA replication protein DnaD